MAAAVGIPVAILAAAFLALGAQLQNQGASRVDDATPDGKRFGLEQLIALVTTPRWLGGSTILGIAVALQLVSLLFAPIAVGLCLLGVTAFVVTAALTTTSGSPTPFAIAAVLAVLGAVLAVLGVILLRLRKHPSALRSAVAAGLLFGFVATLAKIVIGRISRIVSEGFAFRPTDWLILACVVALLAAGGIGLSLVQAAYAAGSPDLVVAALTVIDPLVAVTIGVAVLGEAAQAPGWAFAVFAVAETVAIVGVLRLARHQPEPGSRDEEPGAAGSARS